MSESSSSSGGVGLGALLGVLFIGLKLGKVIDWSWLWVLSPFWIPVSIVVALFVIGVIVLFIKKAHEIATR